MSIFHSPDELSINAGMNTNTKILSHLKTTAATKDLLAKAGMGVIETRGNFDKMPVFILPIVDEKEKMVYVDNHESWSVDRDTREYRIKNPLNRHNNLIYGGLVFEWMFNGTGDFKAGMVYATDVFARGLKTVISSSLRLDVATEFDLFVLCAFYHASLYHEKIDESTLVKITTMVSGICKTSFKLTEQILERIAQNNSFEETMNTDWLAQAISTLDNHSLRNFDYVALTTCMKNMYYSGEATTRLIAALEYPPVWWGFINQVASFNSEKRTPLGALVNGLKADPSRDNFIVRVARIAATHADIV